MENLEKCIDYHNHFTTLSIKDSYILRYKNSSLEEPDFDNSISIYDFMHFFGKMYKRFKEDLDNLPEFNLGESFELWDYSNYGDEREVTIIINNPTMVDTDSCYINIVEKDNDTKCYLSTNDHEYYSRSNEIDLDEAFSKKYIDFLEKYVYFIDCYNISSENSMYSSPEALILCKYNGNLYKNLENIELKIMLDYFGHSYNADIIFDLKTLSVDYDKSNIEGIIGDKKGSINTLLNRIYINKGRIVPSYSDTEEEKTLRLKKGLDM